MRSEWSECRLADVINIKHGFAFKGEFFTDEQTPYQLVTPGNFSVGGGFRPGKGKYYSGPISNDYILRPGDVIVTMTDLSKAADTLGFAAFVPMISGTTWLHNQRVGLVQVKPEAPIRPRYLQYLMRASDYRHWVVSTATGSTVKHTSPGRICEFAFALPSLREQNGIASVLGSLDDRIALLRETNATLEAIAQALFKSWFVDFDPVRTKLDGRVPEGMDEATAALFPDSFDESEIGLVPTGWRVGEIGDVVDYVGGGTPSTKDSQYWEPGEHAWTTPKDLSGLKSPALQRTERLISSKGLTKVSSGLLPAGTLLLSSRAPIGYLAIAQIPLAINQGYIAMLPSSQLPPLYMLFWCRQNMEVIKSRANGSTFMEISKKAFSPIPSLVPSAPVLDAFMIIASQLFSRLVENEKQAQTLVDLRDALLPRLISGQLRLPESETILEEAIA